MARRTPLDADTMLDVNLSAICTRNRYVDDPAPVLAELYKTAGDRTDILAAVVGRHVGFYETDPYRSVLIDALRTIPGIEEHVELGRFRRNSGTHSTIAPRSSKLSTPDE